MEILIDKLTHHFAALPVLDRINIHIECGEIVAFIGPSGCGKSTLLRLVGGLETPTSGSIKMIATSNRHSEARPVFVSQAPSLLPWRTVAGNVSLAIEHVEASKRNQRQLVCEALMRVGLTDFANWYPKALSGGMQQRTNIARALITKPSTLLLDEPFSSLDELTREGITTDLIRLWYATPFTCLYVTHSPFDAAKVAHRVVILTTRPARIREIIHINVDIDKRSDSHPIVIQTRNRIRDLIRTPE